MSCRSKLFVSKSNRQNRYQYIELYALRFALAGHIFRLNAFITKEHTFSVSLCMIVMLVLFRHRTERMCFAEKKGEAGARSENQMNSIPIFKKYFNTLT